MSPARERAVDFPEPDGPMSATISAALTSSVTPRRASTGSGLARKDFVTPSSLRRQLTSITPFLGTPCA